MSEVTLKQIKILLLENNKNLVTKDDLKKALVENNKNLVTKNYLKDYLKEALVENNKNLATKDYLKDYLKEALVENNKNLATKDYFKDYLKEALVENNKNLATKDYLDEKLLESEERIMGRLTKFSMDFVLPSVKADLEKSLKELKVVLASIEDKVDKLVVMESEDIGAVGKDIKNIKMDLLGFKAQMKQFVKRLDSAGC